MSALSNNDTTIISEHFEFGGRVHFSQFYLFVEEKAAMIDSHMLRQVHSIEEAAHLFEEQRTETGTTSLRSRSSVTNPRYEPVDSRAPFGTDNWYRSRSLNNSVSMQLPRSRQSPTASSNQILSERRLRDSSLYRDESKSEQERLRYSTSRLSSQDSYGKKGTAFQSTLDRPPRRPSFTTIKSMHAKSTRSSSPGVQLSGTDTPAPRLRRRSSSFSSTFTDMSKSLPAQLNHQ